MSSKPVILNLAILCFEASTVKYNTHIDNPPRLVKLCPSFGTLSPLRVGIGITYLLFTQMPYDDVVIYVYMLDEAFLMIYTIMFSQFYSAGSPRILSFMQHLIHLLTRQFFYNFLFLYLVQLCNTCPSALLPKGIKRTDVTFFFFLLLWSFCLVLLLNSFVCGFVHVKCYIAFFQCMLLPCWVN